MDRIHDLGGMAGFSSFEIEDNEPTFHEPWEETAFLTNIASIAMLGAYNADEYRHSVDVLPQTSTCPLATTNDFSLASLRSWSRKGFWPKPTSTEEPEPVFGCPNPLLPIPMTDERNPQRHVFHLAIPDCLNMFAAIAVRCCTWRNHSIWFDTGEAERLKDRWMGDALDMGKARDGRKWDPVADIDCPLATTHLV